MPLDPHLAGFLQMLATSGNKPTYEGTVDEARAGYLAITYDSLTPEQIVPVGSVEEATVQGATGTLPARIYRPEGTGPFPTVAYFHGGGFLIGTLDTHDNMCRDVCRGSQSVVVSVDYRLAPEHPFPAGVEDAVAATRWIAAHAQALGGNSIVGVAGDSAGGNLSAVVTQQLRGQSDVALAAQLLIYPATARTGAGYPSFVENGTGYFLDAPSIKWFIDHYVGDWKDRTDPRLAPLEAASLAGLPAAVVVIAEFDPLRDEGEAYGKALQAAGVRTDIIRSDGMIHGFFDMGRWSPAAQQIIQSSTRRFGEVLRGG